MTLKGILFGAWAFATLLGATSASLPHPASAEALTVGDVLPKMKSLDVGGRISTPADKTPAYRLIHFWAAYDAESRAMNQVWDHFFKANPHSYPLRGYLRRSRGSCMGTNDHLGPGGSSPSALLARRRARGIHLSCWLDYELPHLPDRSAGCHRSRRSNPLRNHEVSLTSPL